MKVLVIGKGGREHALAWKCASSDVVRAVFCAPGNAGTRLEKKVKNVSIDESDYTGLLKFAKQEKIDLTIVGPEGPLVDGLVDIFLENNLMCFGPSKKAAILEGSKVFMKKFLSKYNIPSADYGVFKTKSKALTYLSNKQFPQVIKADGLAAGKGVFIANSFDDACEFLTSVFVDKRFGSSGDNVVIEDFLVGEELSYICLTDGHRVVPFASSQDHKTRDDGDQGPNTGGMGAYSPAPILDKYLIEKINSKIMLPTLDGMRKEGRKYVGFLYAGLMIDPSGAPTVLEFNCRFGDPETQPIMMRLRSDLVLSCIKVLTGGIEKVSLDFDDKAALGVVVASNGYPGKYDLGISLDGIIGQKLNSETKIFHAGTKNLGNQIVSDGGRVLTVVSLGETVSRAQTAVYSILKKMNLQNFFYRSDIGNKGVKG